jgi:flagellar hook-length control protein FliK
MSLDPESLGHLDVELRVKGDKLTANIKAETLEAYESLEKEMPALKESLGLAGLELEMALSYDGDGPDTRAMARSGYGQGHQGADSQLPGEAESESQLIGGPSDGRLLDRIV